MLNFQFRGFTVCGFPWVYEYLPTMASRGSGLDAKGKPMAPGQ